MELNPADGLLNTCDVDRLLLNRLVVDVSHAESLRSPQAKIKCTNWIVRHILTGQHEALELLGSTSFWVEEQLSHYRSGSASRTDQKGASAFDFLVDELQRSLALIATALEAIPEDQLQVVGETRRGEKTIWKHVDGLAWHETFHAGRSISCEPTLMGSDRERGSLTSEGNGHGLRC
jgi:hypothetical protein